MKTQANGELLKVCLECSVSSVKAISMSLNPLLYKLECIYTYK